MSWPFTFLLATLLATGGGADAVRLELPSAVAAARFPCLQDDVQQVSGNLGKGLMCTSGGIVYGLFDAVMPDDGIHFATFDDALTDARSDAASQQTQLFKIDGHRAFKVLSTDTGGIVEIVEITPGRLLTVLGAVEPESGPLVGTRADAQARIASFVESLEVLSK